MSGSTVAAIRTVSAEKPERKIKATMPLNEQIATLGELISRPPTNSRVIEFSPKLAEYVLTTLNRNNRPMKPAKIKKYAADLTAGRWGVTGDTIKFGDDELLKDGQNRLSACLRAGKPMTSHVVFGINSQLFDRMDIGKNRTGGDVFAIAGISYAGHVAAAVRWLLILTSDDPADRGAQFSNEELLRAYRDKFESDLLERSIYCALAVRKTCGHPVGPLAALHYLFSKRDQKRADEFFDEWASGRAKRVRAPSRYLQKRLVEIAASSNNRVHENVRNALIIKAWNAFLARRTVSKADMQHAISDPLPKING
ncbi:MAG TPA: hypothetical protein VGR79_01265 [Stellaceae bacterium]|nr:hypothetical protein [Stellaceae bacterium]